MATIDQAVKRLRIEASETGVSETAAKTRDLAKAQDEVAESAKRQEQATQQLDRRYAETVKSQQAYASANDNLVRNTQATGQSFIGAASETLQFSAHLKLAAAAAYIAIPAFRNLVNPAITAGLKQTGSALAAISPAAVSAGGAIVSAMTPAIAFLSRIAVPALAIASIYELSDAITKLGERRRVVLTDLAKNAKDAGVGVDLFQRMKKVSEDASASLIKFKETTDLVGGKGAFDTKLNDLIKAGNIFGGAAEQAYRQSTNTEQQFRAVVSLITQALERGEKLAALDLAATFLPQAIVDRLRVSNDALEQIVKQAAKVKQTEIFSKTDVDYAVDLTKRIDDAQKILNDKWLPIQKALTRSGLEFQELWVKVLQLTAAAVTPVSKLFETIANGIPGLEKLLQLPLLGPVVGGLSLSTRQPPPKPGPPGGFQSRLVTGGLGDAIAVQRAMAEAEAVSDKVFKDLSRTTEIKQSVEVLNDFDHAIRSIASSAGDAGVDLVQNFKLNDLRSQFDVAKKAITDLFDRGDMSGAQFADRMKTLNDVFFAGKEKILEYKNAYTQLADTIGERIEEMQVEISLQRRSEEAVSRLKTAHELERAARKAGIEVSKDEIEILSTKLALTERLRTQARLVGDVSFERDTARLKPEDAQIAQRLREIYPSVAEALKSAEAGQMRFNNALRLASTLARDIKFERDTAPLKPEDAQIAERLRDLYPKVADALKSAEAGQIRFNNALRATRELTRDLQFERDQLGRTDTEAAIASRLKGANLPIDLNSNVAQMIRLNEQLKTAKDLSTEFALSFTRDIRNGVNALTALQNALNKVLDLLIEMAVKAAVAKSVGAASGFDFGSLFGAGKYGGGGAGDQGPTPAMVAHSGGIAGMGGGQRYVHPAYFENAPRYHMGVDEVPAILQRGETVLPRGSSARAPVINLNITNNAGADVQQGQARQNSDGSLDLDIFIERKVTKAIGGGAADSALRSRYRASPGVIAR